MTKKINFLNYSSEISELKKKKINIVNLSLIICTHMGSEKLFYLILSICKSTYVPREIIIVGTHKDDFINIQIKYFRENLDLRKVLVSLFYNQMTILNFIITV